MDPYEVRFTFFWYNDQEIFFDTQEEIDAKVGRIADQGITHLITFSCTHFRWSYQPWWKEINACLAKIVKAAHRRGLKVIEHHSSELASYPDTPQRLERMQRYLKDRGSSIESWPGIVDMLLAPDSPALKYPQISAKTMLPNVTSYAATNKCYNNPEYRKEYLEYLESVYATGIDGIMTDDVQYYCSCRCPYCEQLFLERYGYTLPAPEQWEAWYGNMRDPSFIAWLRFRFDSTHDFHRLVAEHYEKLGLSLLRPNYLSLAVTRDWTAFSVETVPRMDWFFQECARSCVIRYSWLKVLSEQTHRAMVARARKIPHGILFYAYDQSQLLFSWGVAMLAGAFYINTPEGGTIVEENSIRAFEKEYSELLFHARPMVETGFLDSRENRFFSPGYEMSRMEFWMQSCILENIPCVMVSSDAPESWKECRVLCVNEVNILSDKEITDLKAFAEAGGTLIFSGIPGNQDETCRIRTKEECEVLWGISFTLAEHEEYRVTLYGKGKICITSSFAFYPGPEKDIQAVFGKDHMDFPFGRMPFELLKSAPFVCANTIRTENRPFESNIGELYQGFRKEGHAAAELIRSFLPPKRFTAELPEQILAVPFRSDDGSAITIRLLNAKGTLMPPDGKHVSHDDPLPWGENHSACGSIALPLSDGMLCSSVLFTSVDGRKEELDFTEENGSLIITLKDGLFWDFGMIVIR